MNDTEKEQRKLAAIMFTDMVGYSALTQKNEGLALGLLQTHNKLLRSIFPRFKGNEIKSIGDAFLVEYPSALDAVLCAVEIQTILNDYNSKNTDPIQIRIGIHLGDIIIRENDVFGDGVNIAARIEPAAAPGGICISEDVARQVKNKIEYQLVQLPERQLKNIHIPIQLFALQLPWMPAIDGEHAAIKQELPADIVPQIPSVGILPFTNLSSDKENEYLADGIAEDLINALAQLRTLRVLSRTSSFALRGSEKDLRSIGQTLNVQAIVEGSIRRVGATIRVSVRLIDVADGFNLWSNSYDRKMEDVFAIQDDIARAIANALRAEMRGYAQTLLVKPQTPNIEAYQLYLKGRYFWAKRPSGIEKALEYFKKALDLDPSYTLAMVGLADCYNSLGSWENGSEPPKAVMPLGAAYSQKALEIDDSLSEAHTSKAYSLLHYDRDWSAAESEFKRAIELSPNYSAAHHWHSHLLTALGRTEESLLASKRALELDPLDLVTNVHLAWHYQLSSDYDNALEQSARTEDFEPNFPWAHFFLGWAYEQKHEFTKAIDSLAKSVRLSENNTVMLGALGHAYASAGDRVEASRVIKELRDASLRKYVASYEIGVIHAGLGSVDECFQWLEKAVEEHSGWLVYLKREPRLLQLHSDSRFTALLTKVGLSP